MGAAPEDPDDPLEPSDPELDPDEVEDPLDPELESLLASEEVSFDPPSFRVAPPHAPPLDAARQAMQRRNRASLRRNDAHTNRTGPTLISGVNYTPQSPTLPQARQGRRAGCRQSRHEEMAPPRRRSIVLARAEGLAPQYSPAAPSNDAHTTHLVSRCVPRRGAGLLLERLGAKPRHLLRRLGAVRSGRPGVLLRELVDVGLLLRCQSLGLDLHGHQHRRRRHRRRRPHDGGRSLRRTPGHTSRLRQSGGQLRSRGGPRELPNQFFATTPLRSVLAAIPPESGVATVDGFRRGADNPAVAHRRRRRAGAVVRRGRARALHP